jgi:hypothetical protein
MLPIETAAILTKVYIYFVYADYKISVIKMMLNFFK